MGFVLELLPTPGSSDPDYRRADLNRWASLFCTLPISFRWITCSQPLQLTTARQSLRAMYEVVQRMVHAAEMVPSSPDAIRSWIVHQPAEIRSWVAPLFRHGTPDPTAIRERLAMRTWRARWLEEYESWLRQLERGTQRVVRHFLVIDGTVGGMGADQVQRMIAAMIPSVLVFPAARRDPVIPLLTGPYVPRVGVRDSDVYLAPLDPSLPVVQCVEFVPPFRGMWSPDLWMRMYAEVESDLWLVVSATHVPTPVLTYQLDHMMQTARMTANRDIHERGRMAEALFRRARTEHGYDVGIVVAIRAATRERLMADLDRMRAISAGLCAHVIVHPRRQPVLAHAFRIQPHPTPLPLARHRALAGDMVRTLNPWVRSWPYQRGMVWGLSRGGAVLVEPMHGGTAAHTVVIGKTGSGKTFAINTIALRCAAMGFRVIVFDPQGHVKRLVHAAGTGGVHRPIRAGERYNILDVTVSGGSLDHPPLTEQITMVIGLLGVILGTSTVTSSGVMFRPREWDSFERGVLEHALGQLYAPWRDRLGDLTPDETPIIADVVTRLRSLADHWSLDSSEARRTLASIADRLATELTVRILENPNAQIFNDRTSVRWDFRHDLICYDLSETPTDGSIRSLVMVLGIGALLRTIRREAQRSRSSLRPTLVIIDEFGSLLMASPDIAAYAADIAKTGRAFHVGLVAIDQDAQTFLDAALDPSGHRRTIWNNATIRLIFRQDRANSDLVVRAIDGLTDRDRDRLMQLGRGQALFVWETPPSHQQEVTWLHIVPTALEHRLLSGT